MPSIAQKSIYETNKLVKRLRRQVGEAIADYDMIVDGDKVMVCLSGGKDSYTMLDMLLSLRSHAPIHFDIIAINLDQKHPGFPEEILPNYLKSLDVPFHIIEQDTYSIVKRVIPEGKTMCGLCSRMRRGILYKTANQLGVTKIALGHHREDILETFFLNMFHGGRLKAMPPKLKSDNGEHIVIRPLAYCKEKDIVAYAEIKQFPIIPCDLCGSQENLQRQVTKQMLLEWDKKHPGRLDTMFSALKKVSASHLLDSELYDFKGLSIDVTDSGEGDIAFDPDPTLNQSPSSNVIKIDHQNV
ncbi:MAG: tRNA 2-thiocytidine(32) synthetase TtcA [Betaproteobacteria bacterium TMED22]|nr:MAG: tRNA 2-thiocytidine(32) synthetase TtcA [Betaproteobacteria bacterium TMED22]